MYTVGPGVMTNQANNTSKQSAQKGLNNQTINLANIKGIITNNSAMSSTVMR